MHRPFKYLLSTTPSFSFLCQNTTTTTTISKHISSLLLLLLQNNVVVGVTFYHLSVQTTRPCNTNDNTIATIIILVVLTVAPVPTYNVLQRMPYFQQRTDRIYKSGKRKRVAILSSTTIIAIGPSHTTNTKINTSSSILPIFSPHVSLCCQYIYNR